MNVSHTFFEAVSDLNLITLIIIVVLSSVAFSMFLYLVKRLLQIFLL